MVPRRPRVLIADDHPDLVKAICRVLSLDYEVAGIVTDGSAVLEVAQRLQPDVIVLDLNLPNVNGLEACRQITKTVTVFLGGQLVDNLVDSLVDNIAQIRGKTS